MWIHGPSREDHELSKIINDVPQNKSYEKCNKMEPSGTESEVNLNY